MAFSRQQQDAIIQALRDWISVAQAAGYKPIVDWDNALAEVSHSALLHRLLDGKHPHATPPPVAFSYPWHELVEHGRDVHCEVSFYPEGVLGRQGPTIVINQGLWRVLERKGEEFVVTHDRTPGQQWRVWRPDPTSAGHFDWAIERLG
jgi:hypothetical protein